ncbi:hypothetical protein Tco_0822414 [Tanacetum coccineum]|uniref:Uncharacterized protein n=1 Tax=Tanacetum coccineum TaxID=301880 RepID=A0ABQ5AF28_9ASTR
MPKSNNDKKDNKSLKRMARISVRACCFVNPPPTSLLYQCFSPPSINQTTSPSTPLESPPTTPIAPPGFPPEQLLSTLKTTSPPLTSPPPAPTQPSKTINPPPPLPTFDTIKHLAGQPLSIPEVTRMEPPLPTLPLQLPPYSQLM